MARKILIFLSEYGYWGEELVGPVEAFDAAGYGLTFVTPTGQRPEPLPPSLDPNFVDPPLGRAVTTPEMADKVAQFNQSSRLDNPLDLTKLVPDRPFLSTPNYLREIEAYNRNLTSALKLLVDTYDAIFLVGGSGPIVDMANNGLLHSIVLAFYAAHKPIAAECYAVACLAFARDWDARESIILGKHITGHPKEYDYKNGTGFIGTSFTMGPPPYPLEYILRDAVGPTGRFHGNVGKELSAIVDYPFITGRSTPDSRLTGDLTVNVLNHGLCRYGW